MSKAQECVLTLANILQVVDDVLVEGKPQGTALANKENDRQLDSEEMGNLVIASVLKHQTTGA